ncbi:MAG TPA: heavy metal-associated domain-containing protein, partial [Chitinophagaceae bacterium]|nr:heavy metal-associated domain-containing protein [Chitinophagaceae bacterium]
AALFFFFFSLSGAGFAQFKSARLQAAGLTCAMCTKAIYQSLKELSFVDNIDTDIKNSEFIVSFKKGMNADPDVMKKAVEDAGFSVSKLKLTGDFDNVKVSNDAHVNISGKTYHFLNTTDQTLNGEKTFTIVDKYFVTTKEFKKYSAATKMMCVQTGKAESCCAKDGITANTRIYHVTI